MAPTTPRPAPLTFVGDLDDHEAQSSSTPLLGGGHGSSGHGSSGHRGEDGDAEHNEHHRSDPTFYGAVLQTEQAILANVQPIRSAPSSACQRPWMDCRLAYGLSCLLLLTCDVTGLRAC